MFEIDVIDKLKTHCMFNNFFFFENRAVYGIMWKIYGRAGQATDGNIRRMRIACNVFFFHYIFIISVSFFLRMRNVSDKSCREHQNAHFIFSTPPPPKIVPFIR